MAPFLIKASAPCHKSYLRGAKLEWEETVKQTAAVQSPLSSRQTQRQQCGTENDDMKPTQTPVFGLTPGPIGSLKRLAKVSAHALLLTPYLEVRARVPVDA